MKILITGSNGLLGQKLVHLLKTDPEVELIATSRGENRISDLGSAAYLSLDICDRTSVLEAISRIKPHAVINTAAMTNVDACELDPASCEILNVSAVEYLVEACERVDAHFLHLSTDFVFDGESGPYAEEDEPAPLSVYGHSKLRSEQVVMNSGLKAWAIARTIIVYGIVEDMSRSNVVLWAKQALEKGDPINVVNDQWRSPTLAEDLAKGCAAIVKQGARGIYHLSGKDTMSILELVQRVGAFWQLDTGSMSPIASAALGQPAKRPPRTGFILDKARKELGYEPLGFEEGLAFLSEQLKKR